MNALAVVRRWTTVLLHEPEFRDYSEGFAFLAAADARRAAGDCGCKAAPHALSIADRAVVTTNLSAARAAAETGDLTAACQADYLAARLEPCPRTNPTAQVLAARAAADLRAAREVTQ